MSSKSESASANLAARRAALGLRVVSNDSPVPSSASSATSALAAVGGSKVEDRRHRDFGKTREAAPSYPSYSRMDANHDPRNSSPDGATGSPAVKSTPAQPSRASSNLQVVAVADPEEMENQDVGC